MNHSTMRMSTIEPELTTTLDTKHQALKPFSDLTGSLCTSLDLAFQE